MKNGGIPKWAWSRDMSGTVNVIHRTTDSLSGDKDNKDPDKNIEKKFALVAKVFAVTRIDEFDWAYSQNE